MSLAVARSSRRVRPSVSRSDLIPEIGISTGTVVLVVAAHWMLIPYLGAKPPLVLITAVAAAMTFWRGLGPGLVTSTVGSAVGSSLFLSPDHQLASINGSVPIETFVLFAGSLFTCWLIFRLKADNENIRSKSKPSKKKFERYFYIQRYAMFFISNDFQLNIIELG